MRKSLSLSGMDSGFQAPENKGTTSFVGVVANLVTMSLGASILSLPWTMAGASVITGCVIMFIVLVQMFWTNMIIVFAGERHQVFNLADLLDLLPTPIGTMTQHLCNVMIWLIQGLCLISYIIILCDCMEALVPEQWGWRPIWVVLSSCLVFPLCFCDLAVLSFTSIFGILGNVFMVGLVATQLWETGVREPVCLFGFSRGSVSMLSVFMVAVVLQQCILPVYKEMRGRSPARFGAAMAIAFVVVFFLFSLFVSCAYLLHGPKVKSDIIKDFPQSTSGYLGRIFMILGIAPVYPLVLYPMTAPIREREERMLRDARIQDINDDIRPAEQDIVYGSVDDVGERMPQPREGSARRSWILMWRTSTTTVIIIVLVMFASFFCTDLGLMNTINGALEIIGFVALAPSLVGLYLLGGDGSRGWSALMSINLALGVVMTGLGLIYVDNYVDLLQKNCVWVLNANAVDTQLSALTTN